MDVFEEALFRWPQRDWVAGTIRAMGARFGLRLLGEDSLGET